MVMARQFGSGQLARGMLGLALVGGLVAGAWRVAPAAQAAPAHRQASATAGKLMLNVEAIGTRMAPANHTLTAVSSGQAIRIVLYVYFTGLSHPVRAHVELSIAHGGRQLYLSRGDYTVTRASVGGQPQGWRWFWSTVGPCSPSVAATGRPECLPRTPGRYTVQGMIESGGDQHGEGSYLTVR